jgi:hypothetical protein
VEQAARLLRIVCEFWCGTAGLKVAFAIGLERAADGKVALLIASSQAGTTTSSVFDADRLPWSLMPYFALWETPEGASGAGLARGFGLV